MQRFQIGISFHYRGADNFFCKLVCFSRIGKLKQADHFCYGAVNRDLFFSSADRKVGNGTVAENGIRDIRIPFQQIKNLLFFHLFPLNHSVMVIRD